MVFLVQKNCTTFGMGPRKLLQLENNLPIGPSKTSIVCIFLSFHYQCGGYGTAAAVYKAQLAVLRESDMPLIDYVEVVEKVYGFL